LDDIGSGKGTGLFLQSRDCRNKPVPFPEPMSSKATKTRSNFCVYFNNNNLIYNAHPVSRKSRIGGVFVLVSLGLRLHVYSFVVLGLGPSSFSTNQSYWLRSPLWVDELNQISSRQNFKSNDILICYFSIRPTAFVDKESHQIFREIRFFFVSFFLLQFRAVDPASGAPRISFLGVQIWLNFSRS